MAQFFISILKHIHSPVQSSAGLPLQRNHYCITVYLDSFLMSCPPRPRPWRVCPPTMHAGYRVQVLTEGLRATHHRMVKHVTREGQLLGPLWDKLSDTLFAMFSRCKPCAQCLLGCNAYLYSHVLFYGSF